MSDPAATPPADPLGPWAPYIRWTVSVILLVVAILWPRVQFPPLPTPAQVDALTTAVQRIEAGQVQVMRAAGLPQQ